MSVQEKIKIGQRFEREAFEFLKKKFDIVEWLSRRKTNSHYDFRCIKNGKVFLIEAKFLQDNHKPLLRYTQKDADFLITKKGIKIILIPRSRFDKEVTIEKEEWTFIKIKKKTLKRLKIAGAYSNGSSYDDVINVGLNLVEKENK